MAKHFLANYRHVCENEKLLSLMTHMNRKVHVWGVHIMFSCCRMASGSGTISDFVIGVFTVSKHCM